MNMKSRLEQMSIRRKYLLFILIFLFPLIMVMAWFSIFSLRVSQREIAQSYSLSLEMFADRVESNLAKYKMLASSLAVDGNLTALNQAPVDADLMIIWDYDELLSRLYLLATSSDLLGEIVIDMPGKGRTFSSSSGINILHDLSIFENQTLGQWELNEREGTNSLSICFSSNNYVNSGSVLSSIYIDITYIKQLLRSFSDDSSGIGFICNDNQQIIVDSNKYSLDVAELQRLLFDDGIDGSGTIQFKQDGALYQVHYFCGASSLRYGFVYPNSIANKPIYQLLTWMLILLILSILLIILFSNTIRKTLINPIYKLISAFQEVKEGTIDTQIEIERQDEFGMLYEQFNDMTSRLSQTMNDIIRVQKNLERSKLNLLQSQINPHFLYNSLNFTYRMISSEQLEAAEQMTLYLGKYFTYATRINTEVTTIQEEVDNIQTFVEIQKLRYSGKIDFCIIMHDTAISDMTIPRLLIQPIVENVFAHGAYTHEEMIKIQLSMNIKEGYLVISIHDNGKGVTAQRLVEIKEQLSNLVRNDGFALSNIYWRLKLIYNDKAHMDIESAELAGTTVTLYLPVSFQMEGGNLDV